jgi:hypothetical protein
MRTDAINWFAFSELCRSLQDGGKTPLTTAGTCVNNFKGTDVASVGNYKVIHTDNQPIRYRPANSTRRPTPSGYAGPGAGKTKTSRL